MLIAGTLQGMRKLQSQGVHHITIVGADRQTSIDFQSLIAIGEGSGA